MYTYHMSCRVYVQTLSPFNNQNSVVHVHKGTALHTCLNERVRRKEGRSKQGQTNNKTKQHSTPKAVTFPKKNELPLVRFEPTHMYTCTLLNTTHTTLIHTTYSIYVHRGIYTYTEADSCTERAPDGTAWS